MLLHILLLILTVQTVFCQDLCPILTSYQENISNFDSIDVQFFNLDHMNTITEIELTLGRMFQHESKQQTCFYKKSDVKVQFENFAKNDGKKLLVFDFAKLLKMSETLVCGKMDETKERLQHMFNSYVNSIFGCKINYTYSMSTVVTGYNVPARKEHFYLSYTRKVFANMSRMEWLDLKKASTTSESCANFEETISKCANGHPHKIGKKFIYGAIFVLILSLIFIVFLKMFYFNVE